MTLDPTTIFAQLESNRCVFDALLRNVPEAQRKWKPRAEDWCLLEIVCHLHDEEREDFRARVKSVLDDPSNPLPKIDPAAWVTERRYLEQDFDGVLASFLRERDSSIAWLRGLASPKWENAYQHPKVGPVSAWLLLVNWLEHDHLHLRQITKRKYEFVRDHGGVPVDYAGPW